MISSRYGLELKEQYYHDRPPTGSAAILHGMKTAGFVTAGGKSSRMGRDKAWLQLGSMMMIEHVITALRPVTESISIIANNPDYTRLNLPVVADSNPGVGPLEAIRTALSNSQQPRVALVGCDMPFVTAELFAYLIGLDDEAQAIVPLDREGRLEPLCAVYSTAALTAVTDLIASGERKVKWLFDRLPARFVTFSELKHLVGAELFFENINSPEDYQRAVERLKLPFFGGN
jgi:molybdenum cofactor guanylyltransferase